MKPISFKILGLFALITYSNALFCAATPEIAEADQSWQATLAKGGGHAVALSIAEDLPIHFKNNTNVPVQLSFNRNGQAQKIEVKSEELRDLTFNPEDLLSLIGITVTQGVVPGGRNLYGLQVFNLQAILVELLRQKALSPDAPIILTLERVRTWLDPIGLTFKVTASQPAPEPGTSQPSIGSGEFFPLQVLPHTTEQLAKMGNLAESDFVFYNGSQAASVALEYYQDEKYHRIVAAPGDIVFLGKNIGAEIYITKVSLFGGESSPVPMIAQLYQPYTFYIPTLVGAHEKPYPIYQINVPALSWNVWVDKLESIPQDTVPASTLEKQTAANNQTGYEGQSAINLYGTIDRYKIAAFATDSFINAKLNQIDFDRWSNATNSLNNFALEKAPENKQADTENTINDLNLTQTFILDTIKALANKEQPLNGQQAHALLQNARYLEGLSKQIERTMLSDIQKSTSPSLDWSRSIPAENILSSTSTGILARFKRIQDDTGTVNQRELSEFLQDHGITNAKEAKTLIDNLEQYVYRYSSDQSAAQLINELYNLYPEIISGLTINLFGQTQNKTAIILFAQAGAYSGILNRIIKDLTSIINR